MILKIIILIITSVVLVGLILYFVAAPHKISGQPDLPFHNGQIIWSNRLTYLIRAPKLGERIIFYPTNSNVSYLGLIVQVSDGESKEFYSVQTSSNKEPVPVLRNQIISKIY